jgi:hypothetical protein
MYTVKLKTILAGPTLRGGIGDTIQVETLDLVKAGYAELLEESIIGTVDKETGGTVVDIVDTVEAEVEAEPEQPKPKLNPKKKK